MRKWAVAIIGAMAMCACGPQASDGRIVLRIANWGGAGDDGEFHTMVRDIRAQFERENPDIKLQIEGIPGSQEYVSKVLLSHVARSAPDIITLDASSAAVFINNGVLQDLQPFIESSPDFNLDDYHPNVVDIARRGPTLYAIPLDFTPMVMYYNKAIFDRFGVPYPEPGWTTEQFVEKAKLLTRDGTYGFKYANWMPGWIMWLWNRGGEVVADQGNGQFRATGVFDSQQNIGTVTWLRDLIQVHKVAPSLSMTAATGVDPFANGECAMEINGHWAMVGYGQAKKLDLEMIGVAPLPSDLPQSVTVMYESGLAIGKHCKHPEAAWRYIKFMSRADIQRRYHASGIAVSARKDVSRERAIDPREQSFIEIVPSARGPWGARVEGYDLVEDIGQKMMDAVIKQGIDPAKALREAAREIDQELSKR